MTSVTLAAASFLVVASLVGCGGARSPAMPKELSPDQMLQAQVSSKVSVPVDVRYELIGTLMQGQPSTLRLAFTPRVAGQNLRVEFPASDSLTIESGETALLQQKAESASIYRRTLVVTPRSSAAREVRVLVSMDVEGGRYFGIFTVPLE